MLLAYLQLPPDRAVGRAAAGGHGARTGWNLPARRSRPAQPHRGPRRPEERVGPLDGDRDHARLCPVSASRSSGPTRCSGTSTVPRAPRSTRSCARAEARPCDGAAIGREPLERPPRVERRTAVVLSVDERVVTRQRVHGQTRLGGIPAVVPLDQVVHLVERPAAHQLAPAPREPPSSASSAASARHAASSRTTCAVVCTSISRRRTMYGSGPPSEAR